MKRFPIKVSTYRAIEGEALGGEFIDDADSVFNIDGTVDVLVEDDVFAELTRVSKGLALSLDDTIIYIVNKVGTQ